jgi:hypothetical protein
VKEPLKPELVTLPKEQALQTEPPVVARLVVEIRSDGSRTIARGAIEDVASGQRTAIEASGASPLQVALALAKAITQLPRMGARAMLPRLGARQMLRGLLTRRKDK